jgi:cyclopropane fatty-acyl-phospholipid synthase-like methyltransferase
VIAAAKQHGAKAIGYEIEEELVDHSRKAIAEQKLEKLARIESSDMYKADLSDVDVVAVFLYPSVLNKLKPQFEKMKSGTRIVSHQFPIPGNKPDKDLLTESEETGQKHRILLYTLPLQKTED